MNAPEPFIDHSPLRLPRKDWWGEEAFHAAWQELVSQPMVTPWDGGRNQSPLAEVLGAIDVNQRRATVAATFAVWLGCSAGRQILWRGDEIRLATNHEMIKYPTLVAWTQENVRYCHVNSGMRMADGVFALSSDRGPDWLGRGNDIIRQPRYTADDLEVIERMCMWLDTPKGRRWAGYAARDASDRQRAAQKAERDQLSRALGLPADGVPL